VSRSLLGGGVDSVRLAVGAPKALLGHVHSVFILDLCLDRKGKSPPNTSPGGAWSFPTARGIKLTRWLAVVLAFTAATLWADLYVSAPTGMPTGKTVTAVQLWEVFDHALPPDVWVSPLQSNKYEVISAKWMRRVFLPALKQQMTMLWGEKIPEDDTAGTCSGFALVGRLMLTLSAMEAHARAPAAATVIVKQEKTFGGLSATMEDHCVIFVLTDEGPWIVEAQSGAHTKIGDYPNRGTIKLVSVH
jgi:hypothetical protein